MYSLSFWFASSLPPLAPWAQWVWLGCAGAALVGAIVLPRVVAHRALPAFAAAPWRRCSRLLAVSAAVLLVLLFFRSEAIPMLESRFWLAVLVIGDIVWLAFIIRHRVMLVPQQRAAAAAAEQKRKYL